MKGLSLVAALALSGALLGACGSGSRNAFASSKDCTVSVTNTDYNGCDLSGQNLSGLDLQSDTFVRANLSMANLDGANFQGADVKDADLKGVETDNATVCVNSVFGPCDKPGLRGKGRPPAT